MRFKQDEYPVIIYDGTCSLCSRSVDFVLRHDRGSRLRFAASQSKTGHRLMQKFSDGQPAGETILLVLDGHVHARSTAIFRFLGFLPFPWPLLGIFRVIPRPIRDWIYDFVAKTRHRWFGEEIVCRLSVQGFEHRFLP